MYYGDEIGMHDVRIPVERIQDPFGKRVPRMGRDPERTPMQWDSGVNAGFTPAQSTPWLPIAEDFQQINIAAQRNDPSSMLSLTRKLLALRKRIRALNAGGYLSIDGMPDSCLAYVRQLGKKRYLIALNFSGTEQTLSLPQLGPKMKADTAQILLSTHLDRDMPINLNSLTLRADEGCIIALDDQVT